MVKRRPYKLHERTIGALIRSINDCADAPLECHIGAAGISKDTYYEWRKKAEADPKSEYGRQLTRVDRALYQAWRRLHEAAVKHKASEVLFRRHGEFYPGEKVRMDLTSGDMPMQADGGFTVLLELHAPSGVPQRQEQEKPFMIGEPSGLRWERSPEEDKRRRGQSGNGELPE